LKSPKQVSPIFSDQIFLKSSVIDFFQLFACFLKFYGQT